MHNTETDGYDLSLEELRQLKIYDLREYALGIKFRYRIKMKFDAAMREYQKVLEAYLGSLNANTGITYADMSTIQYELGTIEFIKCNFSPAEKFFQESAESADLHGDQVRAEIGRFRVIHAQTYAEVIDYKIAYAEMQNCLETLFKLRDQEDNPDLCDLWIFNIKIHLFDLAVDMGDADEAKFRFEQYKESPHTIDNLEKDPPSKQSLLHFHSKQGRLFYVKKDFDKALESFAVFIDCDLSDWGKKDEEIAQNFKNSQHMARDYLLAGKILKEKGLHDRALEIFKAGMEFNPDHGNLCFQNKIQAELLQLN